MDIAAEVLFQDLVHKAGRMPSWNPTLVKVRTLQKLTNNTDISYSVSAAAASGMISSR